MWRNFLHFSFIRFFWILTFCLNSVVRGQVQIIGSSRPITALPGSDVVLPCRADPEVSVEALTVEWSRTDLKPDPSDRLKRVLYVHIYRDRREDLDMKLPSFTGRTALFTDGLRTGNMSLYIANVTLADNGTYRCFVPNLRSRSKEAFVSLFVEPDFAALTEETPLIPKNPQDTDPVQETQGRNHWAKLSVVVVLVVVCVIALVYPQFNQICEVFKKYHVSNTPNDVPAENRGRVVRVLPAADTRVQMETEGEVT